MWIQPAPFHALSRLCFLQEVWPEDWSVLILEVLQAGHVCKKRGSGLGEFQHLEEMQGPMSQSMPEAEEGCEDGVRLLQGNVMSIQGQHSAMHRGSQF